MPYEVFKPDPSSVNTVLILQANTILRYAQKTEKQFSDPNHIPVSPPQ